MLQKCYRRAIGCHIPGVGKLWPTGFLINIAKLIHSGTVYGCSSTSMAELSSCDRDHMVHKAQNIYHMALDKKGLLTFAVHYCYCTRAPGEEGQQVLKYNPPFPPRGGISILDTQLGEQSLVS